MNAIFAILNPNNTVSINRPLAHAIGLNETIVYGALLAKYQYYAENGSLYEGEWFYSTVSDLGESTTLSEKQQKHCIDMLCFHGLIECRKMGMPAKRYFRIIEDIALLENLIKQGSKAIRKMKPEACSDISAEQMPPKTPNKCGENVGTSSGETAAHTYKTKENKSKVVNPNQSISAAPKDRIDMTDDSASVCSADTRAEYLALIRENIEYDYFEDKKAVNELVDIMLDVVCSNKPTIRVNGEELPQKVVKSRFLKLDSGHIEYVLTALKKNTSDVRNIRAYLMTALYNAPSTMDIYYQAWVNYNMSHPKS